MANHFFKIFSRSGDPFVLCHSAFVSDSKEEHGLWGQRLQFEFLTSWLFDPSRIAWEKNLYSSSFSFVIQNNEDKICLPVGLLLQLDYIFMQSLSQYLGYIVNI